MGSSSQHRQNRTLSWRTSLDTRCLLTRMQTSVCECVHMLACTRVWKEVPRRAILTHWRQAACSFRIHGFFFFSIMIRGRSCCYPLPSGLSVQRPSDGETDVQRSKWSSQRQYSHLNTMHKVLQRQLRVGACHFIYRQGSHASEV